MTEFFCKSKECDCSPDDPLKGLAFVEGRTSLWRCHHLETLVRTHKQVWEKK